MIIQNVTVCKIAFWGFLCVLRYHREDLWGKEGAVWCVHRQSEREDAQRESPASASTQQCGQREVPQALWAKVQKMEPLIRKKNQ